MNIFRTLFEKPWLPQSGGVEYLHSGRAVAFPTAKVGLGVLFAVITVLFSLFVSAYLMRMRFGDWLTLPDPRLLWFNSALLALASVAFHRAVRAAHRERMDGLRASLVTAGIFTFGFLAGQLLAWRQLDAAGFYAATNPANAFFYLFTAAHGVHVLGGLVAWARTAGRAYLEETNAEDIRQSVELCALYWHFLLLVWVALFGLLLST